MRKRGERLSERVERVLKMPYEEKRRAEEAIKALAERRKKASN